MDDLRAWLLHSTQTADLTKGTMNFLVIRYPADVAANSENKRVRNF
jgi:hypothetical protein